jgi:hypothetical protein
MENALLIMEVERSDEKRKTKKKSVVNQRGFDCKVTGLKTLLDQYVMKLHESTFKI